MFVSAFTLRRVFLTIERSFVTFAGFNSTRIALVLPTRHNLTEGDDPCQQYLFVPIPNNCHTHQNTDDGGNQAVESDLVKGDVVGENHGANLIAIPFSLMRKRIATQPNCWSIALDE